MPKSVRIAPDVESPDGQSITFVLAIGAVRQICRLQTTFRTRNQAFSYLHKYRTEFEHVARARFKLHPAEETDVKATLADLRERRKQAQPAGIKTFGSTFKNPDGPRAEGRTAGQLLEAIRLSEQARDMAVAGFKNIETFSFDLDSIYTHEAWRGRIRASAGVGASLAPEAVAAFDDEFPSQPS